MLVVALLVWVPQSLVLAVGLVVFGRWLLLGPRHSSLRAWWGALLIGLPVCPSGVFRGPSPLLAEGFWVLWGFLCCVRFWCRQCSRLCVFCVFVALVLVAGVVLCGVCAQVCVCDVLVVQLGACPRLSGLALAALCGFGGCVLWFPTTPGWGLVVVVCSPAAPFACTPPSFSWLCCLACCSPGALSATTRAVVGVWWGWLERRGSLTLARVPSPGVSPFGGCCLHSSSGCNSVVMAVHLYPFRTNGPAL